MSSLVRIPFCMQFVLYACTGKRSFGIEQGCAGPDLTCVETAFHCGSVCYSAIGVLVLSNIGANV